MSRIKLSDDVWYDSELAMFSYTGEEGLYTPHVASFVEMENERRWKLQVRFMIAMLKFNKLLYGLDGYSAVLLTDLEVQEKNL